MSSYQQLVAQNTVLAEQYGNNRLERFNTGRSMRREVSPYNVVHENDYMHELLVNKNYDLVTAGNIKQRQADDIDRKDKIIAILNDKLSKAEATIEDLNPVYVKEDRQCAELTRLELIECKAQLLWLTRVCFGAAMFVYVMQNFVLPHFIKGKCNCL